MGLKVKNDGNKKLRTPIPAGGKQAVCVGYVDMGTHDWVTQHGPKTGHLVRIFFDVPQHRVEMNGKSLPMRTSVEMTLSLYEKARLYKFLASWKGAKKLGPADIDGFDFDSLVGRPARITIVHTPSKKDPEVVYDDVDGVEPSDPEKPTAVLETDPIRYSIENADGTFNPPGRIVPHYIRNKIAQSHEAKKAGWVYNREDPIYKADADDTPF